jgi:hypothetical protein
MNIKLFFTLVVAVPLLMVGARSPTGNPSGMDVPASSRIIGLPTVRVHPASEDAVWYQAHKIVDLAAVTAHPTAADQAFFLAERALQGSLACRC